MPTLQAIYEKRGVNLCCVAGKYQFRTASDLAFLLRKEQPEQKRLSKAAIETLAIIAYHQPVTRAEIEDIRGVAMSKGTIDILMEVGWVKIRGRKRTPGRPVTYGTTEAFLVQFGLESVGHLPGLDELKAAGFLEAIPPSGFDVPNPTDAPGGRTKIPIRAKSRKIWRPAASIWTKPKERRPGADSVSVSARRVGTLTLPTPQAARPTKH